MDDKKYSKDRRDMYISRPDSENGVQNVAISSPNLSHPDSGIRMYCDMYKVHWNLQIRGFFQTSDFRKGKKWYLANAGMGIDEIRALKDACDAIISEVEGT